MLRKNIDNNFFVNNVHGWNVLYKCCNLISKIFESRHQMYQILKVIVTQLMPLPGSQKTFNYIHIHTCSCRRKLIFILTHILSLIIIEMKVMIFFLFRRPHDQHKLFVFSQQEGPLLQNVRGVRYLPEDRKKVSVLIY